MINFSPQFKKVLLIILKFVLYISIAISVFIILDELDEEIPFALAGLLSAFILGLLYRKNIE